MSGLHKHIYLYSEINRKSLRKFHEDLVSLEGYYGERDRIYLHIYSGGGNALCAMAMVDMMDMHPLPITTIGDGYIASAGTLILAAGQKGQRFITAGSTLMIHQGQTTLPYQDESKNKIAMGWQDDVCEKYNNYVVERIKWSASRYSKESYEDNFMTAEQAVEAGFADAIQTKWLP